MEITFLSGSDFQQGVVSQTAHSFLNLPFESIPVILTVEFVPDPSPTLHNEFAFSEWTHGSPKATTKIASRAPDWALPWRGIQFFREVVAHELGHVGFAALPSIIRVQLAEMFGADSDDEAEINPEGVAWENKINEGIAETFKDAFLPQDLRKFSNRTNHRISLSLYPEFRRLWRQGIASADTLSEQMDPNSLAAITNHVAENPVGSPWIQWPGTEHIGRIWPPGGAIIFPSYGAPVTSGTPRRVGALYGGSTQTQPFGATVFYGGEWASNTTAGDRRDLFFGADPSGDGYSITLHKKGFFGGGFNIFDIQIIKWAGGAEAEVLLEVKEKSVPISGFSFGVSVVNNQITAWMMDPKMQEVGSVHAPGGVPNGLLGLGIERDDAFSSNSLPRLGNIHAGPLTLASDIVIPAGNVQPGDSQRGTVLTPHVVIGR